MPGAASSGWKPAAPSRRGEAFSPPPRCFSQRAKSGHHEPPSVVDRPSQSAGSGGLSGAVRKLALRLPAG